MRGVEQIPWVYDAICAFAEWRGLGRWRRWLVGGARGLTLDLGSGTGRNLPLYPAGVPVIGVEPSADALARARQRAPGTRLVRATAEALPFRRRRLRDGRVRARSLYRERSATRAR